MSILGTVTEKRRSAGVNMTSLGMSRENASEQSSNYILIPHGDRLPEIIDTKRAHGLLQAAAESNDDEKLQRVYDRVDDLELADTIRAITPEGLLIHGTMADAYALSHATEVKSAHTKAAVEASGASNVMFLSAIRNQFAGSVAHYTGHIRNEINNISQAFGSFAKTFEEKPANSVAAGGYKPQVALAA